MFTITGGKGFHIELNGYKISVQFGGENYCCNYKSIIDPTSRTMWASYDAEIAVWNSDGEYVDSVTLKPSENDPILSHQTPKQFAEILQRIMLASE